MTVFVGWYGFGEVFVERHRLDDKFAGARTRQQVDRIYRRLAKAAHPDAGGTNQDMYELNEAKARALLRVRGFELARTLGAHS